MRRAQEGNWTAIPTFGYVRVIDTASLGAVMSDQLFIPELIRQVLAGNIRIPSFQRGFVWDADRVAHLMDSIYKGLPFGSLLFWRTSTALQIEKKLGPFALPKQDPDLPIDYILDGQQRATSIFGVFQTALPPSPGEDATTFEMYFDLKNRSGIQDSNFLYVPKEEADSSQYFPLRLIFNPPAYRQFLKTMSEDIAEKVDTLYERFNHARIPVQTFKSDDRAAVAIVFERINRLGIALDTLQLLSAWTWNEDFDLLDEFQSLAEELEPFGFKDVGEDSDLLLRCCAAIISKDASPGAIISLNGAEIRSRFSEIKNGILGAVDFARANLRSHSASSLPFASSLIPLAVFFASREEQASNPTAAQREALLRWAWRTFFSRRYSKRLEQLNIDIIEMGKLKQGAANALGDFKVDLGMDFFLGSPFNLNTVNTKTFILMLANAQPRTFLSGGFVQLDRVLRDLNKREFHHLYPKKVLQGQQPSKDVNCLANFAILSRADNNKIGGRPPSEYRSLMHGDVDQILAHAICPTSLFEDNFGKFMNDRANLLLARARELIK